MILSINKEDVIAITEYQVNSIFPITTEEKGIIKENIDTVLSRCERCFEASTDRYYSKNGQTYFDILHADQHSVFLYFLSNTIYKQYISILKEEQSIEKFDPLIYKRLAEKVFRLNKMLNACDIYCTVELPPIFKIVHSLGTVIAPGTQIGNYFKITHHCTLGNNNGNLPVLDDWVFMMPGSKIVGKSHIGHHSVIASNTYIKDCDIPPYSIVFGSSPNLIIKKNSPEMYVHSNLAVFK